MKTRTIATPPHHHHHRYNTAWISQRCKQTDSMRISHTNAVADNSTRKIHKGEDKTADHALYGDNTQKKKKKTLDSSALLKNAVHESANTPTSQPVR